MRGWPRRALAVDVGGAAVERIREAADRAEVALRIDRRAGHAVGYQWPLERMEEEVRQDRAEEANDKCDHCQREDGDQVDAVEIRRRLFRDHRCVLRFAAAGRITVSV